MKVFFAAALFVAVAASCQKGTCENDEISLVQKVQVVKHGAERASTEEDKWWDPAVMGISDFATPAAGAAGYSAWSGQPLITGPTPVTDADAIADAMPAGLDDGRVTEAFHSNKVRIRDEIENKAADDISFTNGQRVERKTDKEMADETLKADKKAIEKAKAAAKAKVEKVEKERKEVISESKEKVKKAKEEAEALHIKRLQTEHAARLGRKIGTIEGNDAKKKAWDDYKTQVREEEQEAARERAEKRITAREQAYRKAERAKTAKMEAEDKAKIQAADAKVKAAKAKYAAEAAFKSTQIEGPEGIKNRITKLKADMAVNHYGRQMDADQQAIMKAASGKYPAGDWPIGP